MIEIFGQSGTAACTALLCQKEQATREDLVKRFRFVFTGIDQARFYQTANLGDRLICLSHITSFRFRQMTLDGTLYKIPHTFNETNFFSDYTIRDFKNEKLPLEFVKVAEFKNLIGRALKLEKLMK